MTGKTQAATAQFIYYCMVKSNFYYHYVVNVITHLIMNLNHFK